MVIQRLQTLFLLISFVLMVCVPFVPMAHVGDTPLMIADYSVLLVFDILIAAVLFVCIFLFKNLRLQMKVTSVSMLLIVGLLVAGGVTLWQNEPKAEVMLYGDVLMLVVAVISVIVARCLMKRDHNLLRSADRLR